MDLKNFIEDMDRRLALAKAVKRNPTYLFQIATARVRTDGTVTQASVPLALAIERETKRIGPFTVRKETLRSDIWPAKAKAA
jgi:hypothetical protein